MTSDPKPIEGGRALLFERLTDHTSRSGEAEGRPFRVLDVAGLRESVRRELARLLNTRCAAPPRGPGARERSVLDYGVPDFSSLSPLSGDDQIRIAASVAESVAAFEPRLREVRVRVERVTDPSRSLALRLDAVLAVGTLAEPVSFNALVNTKTGGAEVHEDEPA